MLVAVGDYFEFSRQLLRLRQTTSSDARRISHGLVINLCVFCASSTLLLKKIMDKRIFHLKEYFLSDLSHPWKVAEMAEKVNVSVSHLNRLFKAEFNLSPTQYLQELRLERAADLLKSSFLSIKQIRYCTGFSDKGVFIKKFKKKYGMLPLDYRNHSSKTAKPENRAIFL